MGYMQAFLVGLVQGIAVLPGISRSGSTIVAGLYLGMNLKNAARFSFLISVPILLMVRVTLSGRLKAFSYYVFAVAGFFFICFFTGWGQNLF